MIKKGGAQVRGRRDHGGMIPSLRGMVREGGTQVKGAWSRREELLNADGELRCIFHPLPHQVGPIRAIDKDALSACSFHGAGIPARTHLSQSCQGVQGWVEAQAFGDPWNLVICFDEHLLSSLKKLISVSTRVEKG